MTAEGVASAATASDAALVRAVREENARIVAALTRSFGSFDVAEEAVAVAVEEALREWRSRGVPRNPGGWLMTAARRNALDIVRTSRRRRDVLARVAVPQQSSTTPDEVDERLPLLFGCCHPSLSPEAQLALTLRAVVGLTTEQIARATVEASATVGQRISRAKRKIGVAGVPMVIPEGRERRHRLDIVLTVISVMYDSAHLRAGADAVADRDLAEDALWLASALCRSSAADAEAHGLLSLLCFHRAREGARSRNGELVPLPAQDRSLWDRRLLQAGHDALRHAAELRTPGRWQLHAAIAACHADAPHYAATDWEQIIVLYELLMRRDPSPIVRLNRAVALAEVGRAQEALAELDALQGRLDLHHLWHAVRADVLRRLGRDAEADSALERGRQLTRNRAERRLFATRLQEVRATNGAGAHDEGRRPTT